MTFVRGVGSIICAALAASSVFAQSSGGLRIRVIDGSDKSAVVGATVTLANTSKLVATSSIPTDKAGLAYFPVLRVGAGYVVTVFMDGYAGIRQDTRVSGGTLKDLVIALVPEHVERVTIVDEREMIELDQNEASTKFTSAFIQDLPVAGRAYQNVLPLAPGVLDFDGDGNPNVNGARERDFKTSVGGISNVDPLTGQVLNQVTADSIEDLTVVSAGAGAEFGRAQGGFAQIIQKQGSNDFEGVFGLLYGSRVLDGNGATGIPDAQMVDFHAYQSSIQVSGPIIRDRLWYRLSEEFIDREDPVVLASGGSVVTEGTQRFSTDNQLTWQVSDRNKLALTFRADPRTMTNVGISSNVPAASTEQFQFGGPTYALTWTAPYSPSLLADTTIAYQDTSLEITPTEAGVPNNCASPDYLTMTQCFNILDGTTSGSATRSWRDSRQRLTVKSDATYFKGRMWGASHEFKFGIVIENERYSRSLERGPTMTQDGYFDPFANEFVLDFTTTASLEPQSTQTAAGTTWGLYGEDVLRPLSNLSIGVGLRLEHEQIGAVGFVAFDPQAEADAYIAATQDVAEADRVAYLQRAFVGYENIPGAIRALASQFPLARFEDSAYSTQLRFWQQFRRKTDFILNNTNLAPRLSIAWDPWSDGKTKLSASWGRYYDKIFLAVPASEAEPVVVTLGAGYRPVLAFDPSFTYTSVDRNLKTPYQDEWSVAFEREIWQESSLSLRYIHRNFQQQLQDININQGPNDYGRCVIPLTLSGATLQDSPGVGTVVDPSTGDPYEDIDPGDGDGRLDDCLGAERLFYPDGPGGPNQPTFQVGDGIPDLYILNPGWGDVFRIGNYNTAEYDGITLEFVRRLYKNWQMDASYTWSKATGSGEDYNVILGNDRSTLEDEPGYQSYDVRHAFKFNATTIVPGGVRLGGTVQWLSGLPYSILDRHVSLASAPGEYRIGHIFSSVRTDYPTGQRNDQRNAAAWNFNAKVVKEFNLPKRMDLQLSAEIFNLFGENTYVVYNRYTKTGQEINGTNDAYRRFGRQYQVGMRLAF